MRSLRPGYRLQRCPSTSAHTAAPSTRGAAGGSTRLKLVFTRPTARLPDPTLAPRTARCARLADGKCPACKPGAVDRRQAVPGRAGTPRPAHIYGQYGTEQHLPPVRAAGRTLRAAAAAAIGTDRPRPAHRRPCPWPLAAGDPRPHETGLRLPADPGPRPATVCPRGVPTATPTTNDTRVLPGKPPNRCPPQPQDRDWCVHRRCLVPPGGNLVHPTPPTSAAPMRTPASATRRASRTTVCPEPLSWPCCSGPRHTSPIDQPLPHRHRLRQPHGPRTVPYYSPHPTEPATNPSPTVTSATVRPRATPHRTVQPTEPGEDRPGRAPGTGRVRPRCPTARFRMVKPRESLRCATTFPDTLPRSLRQTRRTGPSSG
jgi:hypothetical protein